MSIPDEFQVTGKAPAQTSSGAYKTYVSSEASGQHSQNLTLSSGTNLDARSDPEGVKSRKDFIKGDGYRDLLLEIGTEELPAKQLKSLADGLVSQVRLVLDKAGLSYSTIIPFATPRRLAVQVLDLATQQASYVVEKRGPAVTVAFDQQGNPSVACLSFAKSCATTVDKLTVRKTDKGEWLFFNQVKEGAATETLLAELLRDAIAALPINKPMRWGSEQIAFVRPVHWVVLLFGETCIQTTLLGKQTQAFTYGHRFHHPQPITLGRVRDYADVLEKTGYVIADRAKREQVIRQGIASAVQAYGQALIDDDLVTEVVGLVEWPVVLIGKFAATFLEVPREIIITAMQSHQKYFPIVDAEQRLLPYFVVVSNILSTQPENVVAGNQRVLHARLADAQFFYRTDLQSSLAVRVEQLQAIIFHKLLGTLRDKSERIAQLTRYLTTQLVLANEPVSAEQAFRAGWLCKADLTSTVVGEFAELQGIMGKYYALHDGEGAIVAEAVREHYQPRFAGDAVPASVLGALVAIADKVDTLVGLFGCNDIPTGDRDPYALRRAALGVLRILIEKQLSVDLQRVIAQAILHYGQRVTVLDTDRAVLAFMLDRLRAWYTDQGIDLTVFAAVRAREITDPLDFDRRVRALQAFLSQAGAAALIAANKRASQLLAKQDSSALEQLVVDAALFEQPSEQALWGAMTAHVERLPSLLARAEYGAILQALATLQAPLDLFFEQVMVMVEDTALRNNRLGLLYQLQKLFLQVADIRVC